MCREPLPSAASAEGIRPTSPRASASAASGAVVPSEEPSMSQETQSGRPRRGGSSTVTIGPANIW
jgi:hypothetical protein